MSPHKASDDQPSWLLIATAEDAQAAEYPHLLVMPVSIRSWAASNPLGEGMTVRVLDRSLDTDS